MTNIQNGTIGIQMEKVASKNTRIETVDALRGFAVMAIVLVHNLEHFIFPVYPENTPAWLNVLDQGIFNVIFSLFAGKAYAIFALLFGFTFYIQWNNRKLSGKDFGYRFLWRMVLLLFFATGRRRSSSFCCSQYRAVHNQELERQGNTHHIGHSLAAACRVVPLFRKSGQSGTSASGPQSG